MSLKQKIQKDLSEAVKAKEKIKTSVLRMLLASILNREKEKGFKLSQGKPDFKQEDALLTEEELMDAVSSEAKKRREAIADYEKGGRNELAEKEKQELKVLGDYLPEQLSEEEVRKMAQEAIKKTGASSVKDMGKVMGELMPKVKGRVDGNALGGIIKELLNK